MDPSATTRSLSRRLDLPATLESPATPALCQCEGVASPLPPTTAPSVSRGCLRGILASHLSSRLASRLASLALLSLLAPPLSAQLVRGAVTERGSGAPLAGVVLTLVDDEGRTVVAGLSDAGGAYELRAPRAGRYALLVKRIGVRPTRTAPFALAADEARREPIEVDAVVPALGAVRVTERASCRQPKDGDPRLVALWEDVRAALTASVLTAQRAESGRVTRFSRDVDAGSGRVVRDERRTSIETIGHLFRSLPAAQLASDGYIVQRADGSTDYYAPDADVLLSEEFLAAHCFRLVSGVGARAAFNGLAFSPTRESERPDVAGVLWLDGASSELRELEFTYTALPPGVPGDAARDGLGGRVRFARLSDGRWIVDDWRIRMPRAAATGNSAGETRLTLYHDAGGSVESGVTAATAASTPTGASIAGTVFDSVAGAPAAGVTVTLEGTALVATTGADGRFSLVGVPAGAYAIGLSTPAFDSLGLVVPSPFLDVPASGTMRVRLALPSLRTRAARLCRTPVDLAREGIVVVTVRDAASGEPLRAAPIRATWRAVESRGSTLTEVQRDLEAVLDDAGRATLCALPGATLVQVESAAETGARWRDTLRLTAGSIGARRLLVRPPVVARRDTVAPPSAKGERARGLALFREHRAAGRGRFLDESALRARDDSRTSDVLRSITGVRLLPLPTGGNAVASPSPPSLPQVAMIQGWEQSGERFSRSCYMQVIVDGMRMWTWGMQSPFDVDALPVQSLAGIELYRTAAETPPEYAGNSSVCGTVAFWTRRS